MSRKSTKIQRFCKTCQKEFFVKQSAIDNGRGIYCSPKCYFHLTPQERFERLFDKKESHECWEWKGFIGKFGYGRFWINNKMGISHRVSYELYCGPIPESMDVLHRCDNPSCVNPNHLFLGTHQDNMDDKTKKGRAVRLKGEQNGFSKLTEKEVLQMREEYSSGLHTYQSLSNKYHFSKQLIFRILKRKAWNHI